MSNETQKIVRGLVQYLKVRNQLELLPEIIHQLEEATIRLAPDNIARVTTAYQLSTPEKKLIQAKLEKLFGRKLQLRLKVNPKILSGMMIKVADKVIDLTLNTDLTKLTRKLKD